MGTAFEQAYLQFPLESPDLLGERGCCDVQPARRAIESSFLGHCQEVPELAQLHD